MNSHWAKKSRVAFALATVAHVLGWAAFLWIVLWPNSYQGVSATPVSVDGPNFYRGVSATPVSVDGPNFYRGVSATLVNVDGTGATESVEVHRYSSFTEVNGYWLVIPLFVPVIVTGLALLFVLTRRERRVSNALVVWGLSAVLLVFCGLGYYSFGMTYLPAAIALIVTAVALVERRVKRDATHSCPRRVVSCCGKSRAP